MVRTRRWLVTEEPEIIRVDKAEVKIESVTQHTQKRRQFSEREKQQSHHRRASVGGRSRNFKCTSPDLVKPHVRTQNLNAGLWNLFAWNPMYTNVEASVLDGVLKERGRLSSEAG